MLRVSMVIVVTLVCYRWVFPLKCVVGCNDGVDDDDDDGMLMI
jgi:hypothetical protein